MRTSTKLSALFGVAFVPGLVLAAFSVSACKKDPVILAESASAVASAAAPAGAKVVAYALDPKSKTTIDMPGVKEHIKGETDAAQGKLDIDLMNLGNSRGEVKIDLTTLKTKTFGDADKDASQTTHAKNWLEVADAANQFAVFAIQSVAQPSSADVSKVKPTTENGEDVRTVTVTVHGDFLVHGHKAPKDVPLEVRFHYPAGAAADSKPTRVDVKTTAPLKVTLKEHDVRPRDNFGKIAEWTTNLVSKVADTADVSLDIHADLSK